jgi:lambda family phage portal protein
VSARSYPPAYSGSGTPGLESGAQGRRLQRFRPPRQHINTLIEASGPTVRDRARWLVRNNAYAINAVEFFAAQTIGDGIVPSWKGVMDRPRLKRALADAWLRWTDEADAEGLTDLYGLQRRTAREMFIAGEVFLRARPRRPEDGLSVPLQYQMLPSEMLPVEDNRRMPGGNEVRQGIEFDAIGRRVAYHFWRAHPDDYASVRRADLGSRQVRVPAEQVLHIIDPVEAGQLRGLSRMAAGIVPLWQLDIYDDAELERKRTAALTAVFEKVPADYDAATDGAADEGDGIAMQDWVPGARHLLPPGHEIQVASPADVGGNYEAFQYRNLLRAAAALGIPYTGLTGDMVRANYSNERAAELKFRRRASAFQHGVVAFQLCRPVMLAWLRAATLAGAVPGLAPDRALREMPALTRVAWIPPAWPWVDPLKDVKAARDEVEAGFRSRSSVIEARGEDPDEVDAAIAAERARERASKLHETPSAFASAKAAAAQSPMPPAEEAGEDDAPARQAQREGED